MALPNDGSFLAMFQKNASKSLVPEKTSQRAQMAPLSHTQAHSKPHTSQTHTHIPAAQIQQQMGSMANIVVASGESQATAEYADTAKVAGTDWPVVNSQYHDPFQPAKPPTDPKTLALIESSVRDIVSHETNIVKLRNEHEGDEAYGFLNTESQYYNYFIERIEIHSQADYTANALPVASSISGESSTNNGNTQGSHKSDSAQGATGVLKNADGTRRKRKSRWGDAPASTPNQNHHRTQIQSQPQNPTQPQPHTKKAYGGGHANSSADFGGSYNESQEEKNFRHASWIHQQRAREMQETAERAKQLTEARKSGSKHMADYLPKGELEKFMRKAEAIRTGNTDYDDSEYQEHKIGEDNVGYHMVEQGGWEEGLGLGAANQGIKVPVKRAAVTGGMGLGSGKVGEVCCCMVSAFVDDFTVLVIWSPDEVVLMNDLTQ
ncbi:hypothetical protein SARC_01369 [Sphaeroforma arctica JP610]|uniref:G-patch domain-containing protein n=1 Tax=Sphaeroforma arctica JP610 TaxID=667725 RepID=A0A0L0GE09_9EUKA|nr:hypothetical protein SARC_01369 [Sphaeroforma arctica JP610]KNC86498.1 hypothetical protein SARC_01369 [Sphaeroforma arctica JP610]|eukprot:XP_014160400.1 hypothetical protein SARC_01369 [Sphaeroforma arctica JP610]